jgi:hypothetical protein
VTWPLRKQFGTLGAQPELKIWILRRYVEEENTDTEKDMDTEGVR